MLRSRRATPIQDIVDGTTTEDRTDCRQDHRLRVGASKHLDGKGRARGERDREPGAVVSRGAGIEQKPRVGSLTRLDTLDNLGPFALQLSGIDPQRIADEIPYAGVLLKKNEDMDALRRNWR